MKPVAGREAKIAKARVLHAQGLSKRAIAARIGVAHSTVWRWLNPDAQREINPRHNSAKRRWDRENYWRVYQTVCPRCGGAMEKRAERCRDCFHSEPRTGEWSLITY